MIFGIILLLVIGLVLMLVGYNDSGTSDGAFGAGIFIIVVTALGIIIYNGTHKPEVDLPEEISQLSSDVNAPDTLLGYKDKDTYYILYPNKHR